MKYSIGSFIWILLVSGIVVAVHESAVAQVNQPQPAYIRISHNIVDENKPLLLIFFDVLRDTGVHGGFVEVAGCSGWPKGRLEIEQGATVGQAMNALVAANPGYQWELLDGAIDLMPRGSAPLLHTRIAKFRMEATDREIRVFLQDLLRLPEVGKREAALGLKPGLGRGGLSAVEEQPVSRKPVPISISVQSLSLQEAFNKVVQASPDGVWIYNETDCNGAKTYTVEMASNY